MNVRPAIERPIVAMGGGGFSSRADPRDPAPLDDLVLDLARERRGSAHGAGDGQRGRGRPRICFIATASGDAAGYIGRFHAAFDGRADATHLGLFDRTVVDIEAFLLEQDAVYVGGGNTASLLAVWRTHGVDWALRRAHDAGVVLAGLSAGAICWFEAGTTDSFGPALQAVRGGLGFIAGSLSPHYDSEPERRPTYNRLIAAGALPDGLAADDGVALLFDGPDLVEAVTERDGARAYRVATVGGELTETALPTRRLP